MILLIKEDKTDFRCNECGKIYDGDLEKLKKKRRAFPCGTKCACGGTFLFCVNGVALKERRKL